MLIIIRNLFIISFITTSLFSQFDIENISTSGTMGSVTINGEIYNHLDIRNSLPSGKYSFKGNGDTESLITCFDHYGVKKMQLSTHSNDSFVIISAAMSGSISVVVNPKLNA